MKNTLTDLNNYLFEALERVTDDDLTDEQLKKEITKSNAVREIAETVIHNGELALKAMKYKEECGVATGREPMPPMLEASSGGTEV